MLLWLVAAAAVLPASPNQHSAPASTNALLSPAYMAPGSNFNDLLALLSVTGLANRDQPRLWLNSSAASWAGVAVMWPYPQADVHWLAYLKQTKGVNFEVAADAGQYSACAPS